MSASTARATNSTPSETGCCPRFTPQLHAEDELQLDQRLFVREQLRMLFHVPLNLARKRAATAHALRSANAQHARPLVLCAATSPWRSDLLIETSCELPGAELVRLSGRFLKKVFEGPYRDTPKWLADMERTLAASGRHSQRMFVEYTSCPDCAQLRGENYVVVHAQLR